MRGVGGIYRGIPGLNPRRIRNSPWRRVWFLFNFFPRKSWIFLKIIIALDVLDFLEKSLRWLVEKSAQNRSLKFRVRLGFRLRRASVILAFLPRFVGSPCVLGLRLKVWIFPTSLLWMAQPNSVLMLLYFGLNQNPSFTGNPATVASSRLFSLPAGSFFAIPLGY